MRLIDYHMHSNFSIDSKSTIDSIVKRAKEMGHKNARAFVSGGCKKLFCAEHPTCTVLDGEVCRYPHRARPSMSGYGVNVTKLMKTAGWTMAWIKIGSKGQQVQIVDLVNRVGSPWNNKMEVLMPS